MATPSAPLGAAHDYEITVNARPKTVTTNELSFADVVRLAFQNPPAGPNVLITVTYRRGEGNKPQGTLIEGQSVRVKDGMIFDVIATDKS